jgi:hypothetical protein
MIEILELKSEITKMKSPLDFIRFWCYSSKQKHTHACTFVFNICYGLNMKYLPKRLMVPYEVFRDGALEK